MAAHPGRPGCTAYLTWWILSYLIPLAAAWPLWYVSHALSLAVLTVLTLVVLGLRPGRP